MVRVGTGRVASEVDWRLMRPGQPGSVSSLDLGALQLNSSGARGGRRSGVSALAEVFTGALAAAHCFFEEGWTSTMTRCRVLDLRGP